ncbi:MAG TPA: glutaredoxin family protein [Candidatus Saccharimonadia bacterium]|jgi:glutaredoxin
MPEVTVYSTTTCPYCRLLKDYLKSKNVDYTDVLLDEQPEHIQAYLDKCGNRGVPCTHVKDSNGNEVSILGFDQPQIDTVIGLNQAPAASSS